MMSDTEPELETEASEEQAVETAKALDADANLIRERLPDDIRSELTKAAFSPGTLRKVLRDTYYMGPIGVGRGGWRGAYGDGQPGTEMRRPGGALYNFPRSWRYAALQRALNAGLITHVGGGRFAATERGVAVLRLIDECPDCGRQRVPGIRSTYYVGNPNSEGHIENHRLITYCPECGGDGYSDGNSASGVSEYDRDPDHVDRVVEWISDHPSARTYGGEREVSEDAASEVPDVDEDATEDLLDRVVEEQKPPSPREQFSATTEGLYGRPVVTIPNSGAHYRFRGTPEAIGVTWSDSEGDIHITREDEDTLKVGMSREVAVEFGVKDALHPKAEGANWTGSYWTVDADALPRVISKVTLGFRTEDRHGAAYFPDGEDDAPEDATHFTVTVTEDAMAAVTVPMLGVDTDGSLIGEGGEDGADSEDSATEDGEPTEDTDGDEDGASGVTLDLTEYADVGPRDLPDRFSADTFLAVERGEDGGLTVTEVSADAHHSQQDADGAYVMEPLGNDTVAFGSSYPVFVQNGGKEALKDAAPSASYEGDYQRWTVGGEDLMAALDALLDVEGVERVTAPPFILAYLTE
jgi:hypothetical protein